MAENTGPLQGLRILDLSRVLAGPSCTQLLADLGADVIKLERPGVGDETRTWGPPFVKDAEGNETTESGYYLSANRNKRSVTLDLSRPEGVALVKRLLEHADVLIENFKVGGLAKYGLAYDDLKEEFPGLIYCSITGFGQDGPYAARPGYDMMAQGIGGPAGEGAHRYQRRDDRHVRRRRHPVRTAPPRRYQPGSTHRPWAPGRAGGVAIQSGP